MVEGDLPVATLEPIGYVRTGPLAKFESPRQPESDSAETNRIELLPGRNFELALKDLEGFDRIWLIWWFHKNQGWRPRVIPPRGPAVRRGVFSTRSPHRPNPIGITNAPLISVDGLTLTVGPLDLLDGTPIFDIKPYLRTVDSHPESGLGWLEAVEALEKAPPQFEVSVSPLAQKQLEWLLVEWGIDLAAHAFRILERDPSPHRTRRILKLKDGRSRISSGAWRLFFRVEGSLVRIEQVGKGYSDDALMSEGHERIVHRDAQVAFALSFESASADAQQG